MSKTGRGSGLSPSDLMRLNWACQPIREAFGSTPYLVGSALQGDGSHRDIDVRLILEDDDFMAMFGGREDSMRRLRLVNTALSALIQQSSGLAKTIDFQIQPMSYANNYPNTAEDPHPRNPLGVPRFGGTDAPDWSERPEQP